MKVGYIRVSTLDQNTDRQEELLKTAGVEKVFIEKISGSLKHDERPALSACINFLREGDILIIESISRLGRSVQDLLNIVNSLNNKNVQIYSIKEPWCDTRTPQGKMIFTIFASLSQFEREQIRQRQLEGIEIAKLKGKYKGRTPIKIATESIEEYMKAWREGQISASEICRQLGISRSTFYRRIYSDWS